MAVSQRKEILKVSVPCKIIIHAVFDMWMTVRLASRRYH